MLENQSPAGMLLPWHGNGRGRRFDPDQVHQLTPPRINHFQRICAYEAPRRFKHGFDFYSVTQEQDRMTTQLGNFIETETN